VLDVALKYGYGSPDSFAKAFTKFHGITPSQAREKLQPKFCCSAENKTYIGGWYYVRVFGNFNIPSVFPFLKRKRRLEIYYFKTAVRLLYFV
jgi:hypothetical protein